MALSDVDVQQGVDQLIARHLMSDESSFNSRTSKFIHRFCNTEFGDLKLTEQEKGIVCCLLLRGAQTPGEIRTRTNRLAQFEDVREVEAILEALAQRSASPLVVKLPREAGKRESRYQHLFSGAVDVEAESNSSTVLSPFESGESQAEKIQALEQQVAALRSELQELREIVDGLL